MLYTIYKNYKSNIMFSEKLVYSNRNWEIYSFPKIPNNQSVSIKLYKLFLTGLKKVLRTSVGQITHF